MWIPDLVKSALWGDTILISISKGDCAAEDASFFMNSVSMALLLNEWFAAELGVDCPVYFYLILGSSFYLAAATKSSEHSSVIS